jgi:starvation-inducible DNA-binding protein
MNNNSYQNQMITYLNQFLSSIAVLTNKMYNYHWNIIGPDFWPLHVKLQEYYEKGNDEFDVIAERIKQLGGYPLTSLAMYSANSGIKEAESKNYTGREAIMGLINDFKIIHKMGSDIASYASSIGDGVTGGLIGDYLAYIEKQLWMLEANLK